MPPSPWLPDIAASGLNQILGGFSSASSGFTPASRTVAEKTASHTWRQSVSLLQTGTSTVNTSPPTQHSYVADLADLTCTEISVEVRTVWQPQTSHNFLNAQADSHAVGIAGCSRVCDGGGGVTGVKEVRGTFNAAAVLYPQSAPTPTTNPAQCHASPHSASPCTTSSCEPLALCFLFPSLPSILHLSFLLQSAQKGEGCAN